MGLPIFTHALCLCMVCSGGPSAKACTGMVPMSLTEHACPQFSTETAKTLAVFSLLVAKKTCTIRYELSGMTSKHRKRSLPTLSSRTPAFTLRARRRPAITDVRNNQEQKFWPKSYSRIVFCKHPGRPPRKNPVFRLT